MILKYWREITIAVLIIAVISLLRDCNPKPTTKVTTKDVTVKIPEVVGTLEPSNSTELPSRGTDSIIYKDKIIYSTHPFDKVAAEKYLKATDSLKNLLYIQSIQERENVTDFSDKNLELKIWTKTQGQLKDIKADYKIKEREVVVQEKTITNTIVKKDKFGVILGGGYNHALDTKVNSSYEVNAGIRLNKVTVLGSATSEKQIGGKILIEL